MQTFGKNKEHSGQTHNMEEVVVSIQIHIYIYIFSSVCLRIDFFNTPHKMSLVLPRLDLECNCVIPTKQR